MLDGVTLYSDIAFTSPAGTFGTLATGPDEEARFELTLHNGLRYQFDDGGLLRTQYDRSGNETEFGYDDANHLTGLDHQLVDGLGAVLSHPAVFTYLYDAFDRVTDYSGPEGSRHYTYDSLGQLLEVTTGGGSPTVLEDYAYDAHGNREESTSYATGGAEAEYDNGPDNRLQSDGTYDYEYDAQGNRTARVNITTGAREEYVWDFRNRLAQVTFKNDAGAVTHTAKYAYDVGNHRIKKQLFDASGTLTFEERYVYDGDTLLFVIDGSGELKTRLFTVGDQTLGQQRAGQESEWLLADKLGSTRAVVTAAGEEAGSIEARYDFDAYGNLLSGSGDPSLTSVHWTGLMFDGETGNYYAWNRYLDPRNGDWLSVDPIGFASGTANLSEYVGNDPVNNTDQTGLEKDPRYPGFDFPPSLSDGARAAWAAKVPRPSTILTASRGDWVAHAYHRAGLSRSWNPAKSTYQQNREQLVKIYSQYRSIFLQDPEHYVWAGGASHAGSVVILEGIDQLQREINWLKALRTAHPEPLLEFGISTRKQAQTILVQMAKAIFDNIAWQFEAHSWGGTQALVSSGLIDIKLLAGWKLIDANQIEEGTNRLVEFEQLDVLNPLYVELNKLAFGEIGYQMGQKGDPRIPGAEPFRAIFPRRTFGDVDPIPEDNDRFQYIRDVVMTAWYNLTPEQKMSMSQKSIHTLSTSQPVTTQTSPAALVDWPRGVEEWLYGVPPRQMRLQTDIPIDELPQEPLPFGGLPVRVPRN